MGMVDVRNAFNGEVKGAATLTSATMNYERVDAIDFQRLEFEGSFVADNTPFVIRSDRIAPQGDLMEAARATAARLLREHDRKPGEGQPT